jgi:AcrR family transcriptional regulator
MSTTSGGRENQKERTRRAIVAAAAKLIADGTLPSMSEVADEALVSTATAYRYFPDQLSLLSAALRDGYAGMGGRFQPDIGTEPDPERRVDLATAGLLRRIIDREALVRAVMALSLLRSVDGTTPRGDAVGLRPGFRREWIDEALRPVENKIDPGNLRLLKLALGVVMSSEALFALEDVMGVGPDEAIEVCRWMACTLTGAVIRAPGPGPGA